MKNHRFRIILLIFLVFFTLAGQNTLYSFDKITVNGVIKKEMRILTVQGQTYVIGIGTKGVALSKHVGRKAVVIGYLIEVTDSPTIYVLEYSLYQ